MTTTHTEPETRTITWQVIPFVSPIATVARSGEFPLAVVDFSPLSGYRAMLTDGTNIGTFQSLMSAQRAVERRLAARN